MIRSRFQSHRSESSSDHSPNRMHQRILSKVPATDPSSIGNSKQEHSNAVHYGASHTAANVSKYNRFEQLLKNLVGRKMSREPHSIGGSSSSMTTATAIAQTAMMDSIPTTETIAESVDSASKGMEFLAADDIQYLPATSNQSYTSCIEEYSIETHRMNAPLLMHRSPEIKISRTPSAHSLYRNGKCNTATSTTSINSLNTTVQQRLWSVVPLLRREASCTSLNQPSSKLLIHQRADVTLKKCETVSALSHSQTTSAFEPIKARNRLRQSQSIATCSRCSSILSLAANGSRYSLNIANGGFVAIKNDLRLYYSPVS